MVSVDESELRLTALCDVTVIQGEAAEFKVPVPAGYELTTANGSSVESSDVTGGILTIRVHDPARRTHQFLIAFERANRETNVEAPILEFPGAQRETGELLVEGAGAMELKAKESGGLRRIDVREANAITRSLSHFPLQAAFRYNRKANEAPKLQLEWQQFQDADVLSAVAERATVTTLANVEGRTLTEISLRVRNHSKHFMKVDLPPGAQLFTAEVDGERVKPAKDEAGGMRIPLTRAGLDSSKPYTVSFVYQSEGARFAKNGSYDMALPKLDLPVNVLTWEVALPERLEVKQFGGNAIAAELLPAAAANNFLGDDVNDVDSAARNWTESDLSSLGPGQIGGIVVDPNGAVVPGAQVSVTNTQTGTTLTAFSGGDGHWVVSGLEPGPVRVNISAPGFKASLQDFELSASKPARMGTTLEVGNIQATVNVTVDGLNDNRRLEDLAKKTQAAQLNNLSQNVFSLQRRVAGLLPVAVEVPRSGKSYRFVRPLVLEEETRISFQYKSK